ncbi:MAG: helix-turn-helix transcriptional regulator [Armatimonadetes bacterium]|nr:helix-turn-helix transcriptional regulator [Armatimonadota bacterium]
MANETGEHQITPEQLRALGSEVRQGVFQAFQEGPRSVAEVAERINRPEKSLYYHVAALERVGLIEKFERRHTAKKPQWVYALRYKRIKVEPDLEDPEMADAAEKHVLALMRAAGSEYKRAVARYGNKSKGLGFFQRQTLLLDEEGAQLLREKLRELIRELPQSTSGHRMGYTVMLSPIEEVLPE